MFRLREQKRIMQTCLVQSIALLDVVDERVRDWEKVVLTGGKGKQSLKSIKRYASEKMGKFFILISFVFSG